MESHKLALGITAFIQPEGGSSAGLIQTKDGYVLIDTTSRPGDIQEFLAEVGVSPSDVIQVLITHSHSDHTSGIPLFDCPVLAHKLTRQRIAKRGTARAKKQIPSETFEKRREIEIGGVQIGFIHVGGHTPGSSVVWLPESKVLFSGDLIFEGRYPFLATANIPDLMKALKFLLTFNSEVIVPGHGLLCGDEAVLGQLAYIEDTWARTDDHLAKDHSMEEAVNDPSYPKYSELGYPRLHEWNIEVVYRQLKKLSK